MTPNDLSCGEQLKFCSYGQYETDKTIQELAVRIPQGIAACCDLASIRNPQHEAMCTPFIGLVGNKVVLKILLRINDDELTYKAVDVALEMKDTAKVAEGIPRVACYIDDILVSTVDVLQC